LPNNFLHDTADDAPETHSERMFDRLGPDWAATDPTTGQRRGLKSAFAKVRAARKRRRDKRSDAIGGELAA